MKRIVLIACVVLLSGPSAAGLTDLGRINASATSTKSTKIKCYKPGRQGGIPRDKQACYRFCEQSGGSSTISSCKAWCDATCD